MESSSLTINLSGYVDAHLSIRIRRYIDAHQLISSPLQRRSSTLYILCIQVHPTYTHCVKDAYIFEGWGTGCHGGTSTRTGVGAVSVPRDGTHYFQYGTCSTVPESVPTSSMNRSLGAARRIECSTK